MTMKNFSSSLPSYISYILLVFLFICTPTTIDCSKEQYRRCRDLHRTSTSGDDSYSSSSIITIVSPLQGFYDSKCELCPNTFTVTETMALSASNNNTRAVVFATSASPSFEKILTVAAGLLSSKSHLTIVTGPNMPDPGLIRQVLFQHVPCDQHLLASMLLDFKQLNVDDNQLPCPRSVADPTTQSPGDVLLCNIQNAEVLVNAFTDIFLRIPEPSVFLMEATCIAGLLAAEKFKIPAVLMVENAEVFLTHVLGAPKLSPSPGSITKTFSAICKGGNDGVIEVLTNLFGLFNFRILYQRISSGFHDRLNSLDLTSSFIAMNRVRARLKLRRLRLVADMWRVGGNILLVSRQTAIIKYMNPIKTTGSDSDTYNDRVVVEKVEDVSWKHVLSNLYTIPDPLLPPCIACTNAPITTRKEKRLFSETNGRGSSRNGKDDNTSYDDVPVVVLSVAFRNDEKGRSGSRRLMMAFWLARQSIRSLSKIPCNSTITNDTTYCWKGPSDFQVVRPGIMPEVLPPGNDNLHDIDEHSNGQRIPAFVTSEETTYLDTLARHQPVALVSVCDSTNAWTQTLGPPILCLDTSWPARKIAISIVNMLRNMNPRMNKTRPTTNGTASTVDGTEERKTEPWAMATGLDGLQWIVAVLERLAILRNERKYTWDSSWKMSRDVLTELERIIANITGSETQQLPPENVQKSLLDLMTLCLAWSILIASILYLPLKDYATSIRLQRHRGLYRYNGSNGASVNSSRFSAGNKNHENSNDNHQFVDHNHNQSYRHPFQENLSLAAIVQELYFRLPELEFAWNMYLCWIKDTLCRWYDNGLQEGKESSKVSSSSTARHGASQQGHPDSTNHGSDVLMNNSSSNGSHRKRRSVKKRH